MKTMTKCLVTAFLLALGLTAQSANVLLLNFDTATIVDDATYDFGTADIPASGTVSIYFNKPWVGSERDYGLMPPDPGTDTGNYPDIVDIPAGTAGFQADQKAFWTCTGDVGDSQQHIGWYINSSNVISVSGDFTAEALFMLAKIETSLDPIEDSEYGLHNIFGTDMIAGSGAAWKFRVWPNGPIGGSGQLQLWTGNTITGIGENDVDGPPMAINTWYHVACVYTASTNTIELFLDGVSQGTTNPAWSNLGQDDWWIGAWPSNGANRGLAGWIDAVALSDTALAPGSFVLPTSSQVGDWSEY